MDGPYGLVDFNFGWQGDYDLHFIIQYGTSKVYADGEDTILFVTECDYPIVFCSLNYNNSFIPGTDTFGNHSPFYISTDTKRNDQFNYRLLGNIPTNDNSESYITMHWLVIGEYDY